MKIMLSTHLFLYHDLLEEDVLKLAADEGFSQAEIWAMKPHFPYDDPRGMEDLCLLAAREGVEFHTAHLPIYEKVYPPKKPSGLLSPGSPDPEIRVRWRNEATMAARAAATLGAKYLTIHGDLHLPGPDPRAARVRESLLDFISEDLPQDAILCLENAGGGPEQVLGLLDLLNDLPSQLTGLTLDLGHALLGGDVPASILAAGSRLRVVHAHDNDGHYDKHWPPGRGCMPWEAVLKALSEINFSGPFIWEIRDPTGGADLHGLRSILEEIRKFDQVYA
ncbi:MAG: sugar phosphate isomerase/epimerase [Armatimonadetes bacterium]|nr:sugar phosphate isomerase/epimerase [Armatimonadota bacterium]